MYYFKQIKFLTIRNRSSDTNRYAAMNEWSNNVASVCKSVLSKAN
jgi:hypothetical protein